MGEIVLKLSNMHYVQEKILQLIEEKSDEKLTIRKIQFELGLSSTSIVSHHLTQLEIKGYLKRCKPNVREYQILTSPEKKLAYLKFYGLAQCGKFGKILDDNSSETLPIPTKLLSFPSSEAFIVKAKGDSMSPRINDGDLVIARNPFSFVKGGIYICVNNDEAMIKKVLKDNAGNLILSSLNPKFDPFLAAPDFRIVGEVKVIISDKIT